MRRRGLYRKELAVAIFILAFLVAALLTPRPEIVRVEAIPTPPPEQVFPLPGKAAAAIATSEYGPREAEKTLNGGMTSTFHRGIDFACAVGAPLLAVEGGIISFIDSNPRGWGVAIGLKASGTEFIYAHLTDRLVPNKASVKPGDTIATCGQSGNATGPHLHFEQRPNGGEPINPRPYLEALGLKKL